VAATPAALSQRRPVWPATRRPHGATRSGSWGGSLRRAAVRRPCGLAVVGRAHGIPSDPLRSRARVCARVRAKPQGFSPSARTVLDGMPVTGGGAAAARRRRGALGRANQRPGHGRGVAKARSWPQSWTASAKDGRAAARQGAAATGAGGGAVRVTGDGANRRPAFLAGCERVLKTQGYLKPGPLPPRSPGTAPARRGRAPAGGGVWCEHSSGHGVALRACAQ
jgi:hypothetical protein